MKKASFTSGAFLFFVGALLALMTVTPQSAQAQVSGWSIEIIGLPRGGIVPLGDVIDASGELKVIPGMNARISGPPGTPENSIEVFLEAEVRGANVQEFSRCNGIIATAITQKFRAPRTITANDFTGSGGIGIESDTQNEGCTDDLEDKRPTSLPAGQYFIKLTVRRNDASKEILATTEDYIDVVAASVTEINARWLGPEGEITSTSPTIDFQADKTGTVYVYEQTRPGQTAQEAITNPQALCLEYPFLQAGTSNVTYQYPGNARKGLQYGKSYFGFVLLKIEGIGGRIETKSSEIVRFYVRNNDPNYNNLVNALTNAPDDISSTFANLTSSGYTLNFSNSNPIKISSDGGRTTQTLDITQFLSRLSELSRMGVKLTAGLSDN